MTDKPAIKASHPLVEPIWATIFASLNISLFLRDVGIIITFLKLLIAEKYPLTLGST